MIPVGSGPRLTLLTPIKTAISVYILPLKETDYTPLKQKKQTNLFIDYKNKHKYYVHVLPMLVAIKPNYSPSNLVNT